MKWIPLNGKKDPEFNISYALHDGDEWFKGELTQIQTTPAGKEYNFQNKETGDNYTGITHYMKIEPPKNKQ